MRAVLGCAAVLALAGGVAVAGQAKKDDGKKPDPKKLVGRWEPVPEKEEKKDKDKKDKAAPGPGMVIEFAADPKAPAEGRVSLTAINAGREDRGAGTYKLDGDTLTVSLKMGDKEHADTLTVKSLTDTEFVTEDSRQRTEAFRRKK